MTEVQLSATIQRLLEYLQYNAGTPITVSDLCTMVDCNPADARIALDTLTQLGRIERLQQVDGTVAYVVNRYLEPVQLGT
jgi:DNA-binding IclR family transcriptional regulator